MPEYLDRSKRCRSNQQQEVSDQRDPLKSCAHPRDYRCCCHAHQDAEQDSPDLVDELTMNPGYRLCRAYSRELYDYENLDD